MTSNIINMADRTSDREDALLSSLFAAERIADDGFSDRIVRKIRLRLWVQRLALPVAATIGLAVALNPLMDLLAILPSMASLLPGRLAVDIDAILPSPQNLILASVVLVACLGTVQFIDD